MHSGPVASISACTSTSTENDPTGLAIQLTANADDILFVQTRTHAWLPALRSEETDSRHVAFVQLDGMEIALWRDDLGALNAWENRCPHRGTRLTIGANTGVELVCRYHGWKFASGTGVCTAIPAHPGRPAPRAARVLTYACSEKYGLIWVRVGGAGDELSIPQLQGRAATTLRSVAFSAPAAAVADALRREAATAIIHQPRAAGSARVILLVVPQDEASSVVHGIIDTELRSHERMPALRAVNDRLKRVRSSVEP